MNEASAREKWCPFAVSPADNGASVNRDVSGQAAVGTLCLGSGCMAWREMQAAHAPGCASMQKELNPRPCNCGASEPSGYCARLA